jgi:hypothetical protein
MESELRRFGVSPLIGALGSLAAPGLTVLLGWIAIHHGLANTRLLNGLLALILAFGTYLGFSAGRSGGPVIVRVSGYLGCLISAIYFLILAAIALLGMR